MARAWASGVAPDCGSRQSWGKGLVMGRKKRSSLQSDAAATAAPAMAAPESNGFPSSDRRACGTPAGATVDSQTKGTAEDGSFGWRCRHCMVDGGPLQLLLPLPGCFEFCQQARGLQPVSPHSGPLRAWNQTLTDAAGPITVAPQTHFLQHFPQIHQPSALSF